MVIRFLFFFLIHSSTELYPLPTMSVLMLYDPRPFVGLFLYSSSITFSVCPRSSSCAFRDRCIPDPGVPNMVIGDIAQGYRLRVPMSAGLPSMWVPCCRIGIDN